MFRRKGAEPTNATAASWLAWPTLKESNALWPMNGTSHYQQAIEAAAQGRTATGPSVDLVMAELRSVRDGEYTGAVYVFLGGAHVGAVPRAR